MSIYSPNRFAAELAQIRPALINVACQTRPCQPEDAEDLVAEAARLALLILERFDPTSALLITWMKGILRIVILRDREKQSAQVPEVPLDEAAAVVYRPAPIQRDVVQRHIDRLPVHLRVVMTDHLDGYTQREIAARYEVSLRTVTTRFRAAVKDLQCGFRDNAAGWISFFDTCAEHATYTAPAGFSAYWKHQHPPQARPRRQRPEKRLRGAARRRAALVAYNGRKGA